MIAILAFGSLIDDPGTEIEDAIAADRKVQTPFSVEFARLSETRNGAPTLVPVDAGGDRVEASLLVLKDEVSLEEAKSMLWRRETDQVGSGKNYKESKTPSPNKVLVKDFEGFEDLDHVLFVDFPSQGKLKDPTAELLADQAINSARSRCDRKDGISYLLNAKKSGIVTPLTADYERKILDKTKTRSLEEARGKLRTRLTRG
ncbi:hypothetical protein MYX82_04295 [Acidobacteria bacterium AH-259-D05]|nr:hypothetical protein [Acidobacteria bacterium AH-259-D05]